MSTQDLRRFGGALSPDGTLMQHGSGRSPKPRITIVDARLLRAGDPARHTLHIADGRILAVGDAPQGFEAEQRIDARGALLVPGLVDLSARLREPGFEYRASMETEMHAAVAGGVTGLVCPPDTDPPLDEPGLIEMLVHRAMKLSLARLYPLGALTMRLAGEQLTEMAELSESGCVGFSQATSPIVDTSVLLRALQYARTFDYTVWLPPVDPHIGRNGVAHSGPVATRLGLNGVPVISETLRLMTIFEVVRSTGCRVHLCRLSSAAGVDLVRRAKAEGLPVTADVAVHHLHLCDVDIGFFDSRMRVDPPFRAQRDRAALRAALADGTLDAICSDHTPVDEDAKVLPFGEAEAGATALELLLPLTLKWAQEEKVPLESAMRLLTEAPARIAGVPCARLIPQPGDPADLCLVDPEEPWIVDAASLLSQGKHTPYSGRELCGRNRVTLVGGRVVFDRGQAR